MKTKEITGKNENELKEMLKKKKSELTDLMLDNKQNKLKNTRSIFNTRKDISKILTIIGEKKLLASVELEGSEIK